VLWRRRPFGGDVIRSDVSSSASLSSLALSLRRSAREAVAEYGKVERLGCARSIFSRGTGAVAVKTVAVFELKCLLLLLMLGELGLVGALLVSAGI